jgi:hypothetical protein
MRSVTLAIVFALGCGDNTTVSDSVFPASCDGGSGIATATPLVTRGYDLSDIAHTEPRVALWGANNLLQAWQGESVGFASSSDDGQTWTFDGTVDGSGGQPGDVSLATDANGTVYLVTVQLLDPSAGTLGPLLLSRLSPAGSAFTTPISVSTTSNADKPTVAFDSNGLLAIMYKDESSGALDFIRSTDASVSSFTDPLAMQFAGSSVLFDGKRAVFCVDKNGIAAAPIRAMAWPPVARLREDSSGTWDVDDSGSLVGPEQDPACVVDADNLWIAYAAYDAAPPIAPALESELFPADGIQVLHSKDGGLTFDYQARVTPPLSSATKYLFPEMVLTESGHLELLYYAGEVGGSLSLMRSTSPQGGCGTWSTQMLADAGTFQTSRQTDNWLGDYFGVLATGQGVVAAFTDNGSNSCLFGGTCSTISSVSYGSP